MKLSTKLILTFALLLSFSISDSVLNYKLSKEVELNTKWLTDSESIIRLSSRLQGTIFDMESSFRGYLLTDNDHFLDPFIVGKSDFDSLYTSLDSLVISTPAQHNKLLTIQALYKEWLNYAEPIILAKQDTSGVYERYKFFLENATKKERGKEITDKIREEFRNFNRFEYNVREERRGILSESIDSTRTKSVILNILSILVSVLFAIYITRNISRRIRTMVQLAARISSGDFKTVDLSREKDELSDLSVSLNDMAVQLDKNFAELEAKNKELDQYAYVVSHDLKAPLRGIDNISNWIEEDLGKELSPQLRKYLDMMKVRIHRLEGLIDGILQLAKIGRVKKTDERVDVKELLEGVIDLISPPKEFEVTIEGAMPVLNTDKVRLEQVFSNLIGNAIKYNDKENGKIIIGVRREGDFYEFSVSDNGPGIEPQYHDKIFKLFQTLQEKDAVESTGVGLSIVKKIIEDQKGTIKVMSEHGKGTTFAFTWPVESSNVD
jgi:signal transduction histidine kinase